MRQLMQRFSNPQDARALLQQQQNSGEAMRIKRDADPMVEFCGYLFATAERNGLHMGNASIRPLQPKRYLYHAYLAYMEANGYPQPAQHEDLQSGAGEHPARVWQKLPEAAY